jgi:hypothetical protein
MTAVNELNQPSVGCDVHRSGVRILTADVDPGEIAEGEVRPGRCRTLRASGCVSPALRLPGVIRVRVTELEEWLKQFVPAIKERFGPWTGKDPQKELKAQPVCIDHH